MLDSGTLLSPGGLFLLARFTDTVHLESVAGGQVVVFASDLFFYFFDLRGEEFDRGAAFGADHVVMAAPIVLAFVTGDTVVKLHFAGEAAVGQQFERAVDGGKAYARIATLDEVVQLFGGEMVVGLQEGAQNGVALPGMLQADSFQVIVETLLGLADRFVRELGLVVNAFGQGGHRYPSKWYPFNGKSIPLDALSALVFLITDD